MKLFGILMLAMVALTSCDQADPTPSDWQLASISVEEGEYAIEYLESGKVAAVRYTEGVDVTNYNFTWSNNDYTLTMLTDHGNGDVALNKFEFLDVKIGSEVKKVIYKVTYDMEDEGAEDGKSVQVNWITAPNEAIPSIIESFSYNTGDKGDASWFAFDDHIRLEYTTNVETVEVHFDNQIDAWWTKLPVEVSAVLFENEFDYPYFLSLKEVTSIVNTYENKNTEDYNNTFSYFYGHGNNVDKIVTNEQDINFIWIDKNAK